jgi:hypothetical protein
MSINKSAIGQWIVFILAMTTYNVVGGYQCFGGTCCSHVQLIFSFSLNKILNIRFHHNQNFTQTLRVEAIHSFKGLIITRETTRCHISKEKIQISTDMKTSISHVKSHGVTNFLCIADGLL